MKGKQVDMTKHDIIVIGASAGGVEALMELVRGLPPDLPAAVLIVLHVARRGTSIMPHILNREATLPARHPQSGERIEPGNIYLAPNDHHLLVKDGCIVLDAGPRENGFRPAVDSLFRTAAKAYGSRVVGVVLTGLLDNGSAGLVSVKANGGIAIVQDPADAMFPDMPENALKVVEADYVLPLAQIPTTLARLAQTQVPQPVVSSGKGNPGDEADDTGTDNTIYTDEAGKKSDLVCPECGGSLVEYQGGKDDQLVSFRCRVGHRYSLHTLLESQSRVTEAALWAAVRSLEENGSICRRMAQQARASHQMSTEEQYLARAEDVRQHAEVIRRLLRGHRD